MTTHQTPPPPSWLSRLDLPRTALLVAILVVAALIVFYGPEDVRSPAALAIIALVGLMRSIVRPVGGAAVALLIALTCSSIVGCGASALRVHALAADTSGRLLDATCREVRTARDAEQQAVPRTTLEETRELVDAVRARWSPAVASCQLVADVHTAWVDAIVHAAAVGELDLTVAIPLAAHLVAAWGDLAPLTAALGVPLPAPPAELVQLTSAGER